MYDKLGKYYQSLFNFWKIGKKNQIKIKLVFKNLNPTLEITHYEYYLKLKNPHLQDINLKKNYKNFEFFQKI